MVSRAESDEDFAPSIERFMSLDRNMTSSIDVALHLNLGSTESTQMAQEDLYGALSQEMRGFCSESRDLRLQEMQRLVRKALAQGGNQRRPTRPLSSII